VKDLGRDRDDCLLRGPDPSASPQDDKVRTAQGFFRTRLTRVNRYGQMIAVVLWCAEERRSHGLAERIMAKRRAFTLIELLVVIAIVAVLMAILMPALQRVREQARQKTCAARVRQQVLSLHMYAQDNDTKMPVLPDSMAGGWLQNLSVTAVNHMLSSGMTQKMFCCPSNETHKKYAMICWMHHLTENPAEFDRYWNGSRFINYDAGDRVVAGYFFIIDTEKRAREPITRYASDNGDKRWIYSARASHPSDRELVTDLTMGQRQGGTRYGYNFGMITMGGLVRQGVYDRTSHVKTYDEPRGGNVGFLDGHVSWRTWNPPEMPEMDENGELIPRWAGHGPDCFW
jgi:prepilin-type N-terminal cleavage/methylation domain-containing protein/prepilin-type processing-associated H-X9-DG protein